jgi:hypothetical protein
VNYTMIHGSTKIMLFWFFNFPVYFDLRNFNCSSLFVVYCLVFSVCVGSLGICVLVSIRAALSWVLTFVSEEGNKIRF